MEHEFKKTRILCYGDSNTWGYVSGSSHQRYGDNERWPKLLANLLGEDFEIIEEGLNSRTLTSDDPRPGKEGRSGYDYLFPCLDSHDPIDLVILMLGTNELKHSFGKTPAEIGEILEQYFVLNILNRKSQFRGTFPKLLIVTPPTVNENTEYCKAGDKYLGATQKSAELDAVYKKIAEKNGCYFLSNAGLETGPDGVHLTLGSHQKLARSLAEIITQRN